MTVAGGDRYSRPRFLVTGGTGFIGRRLVRRLAVEFSAGSVLCLTRPAVTPQEADTLAWFRQAGIATLDGDLLRDPVSVHRVSDIEAVFHLAANIDTDATEAELRVNDLGTDRLLDWLGPALSGTRLVYTSSIAIHDRRAAPHGPIVETSPQVPRTAYGSTKLRGETVLRQRSARDRFSFTILRLPTVYGPGQKPDGLFDKLAKLTARGDLPGRIDWPGRTSIIFVDDVVSVMIDMARRADTAGETYCLASDESLTVGEIARRVGSADGHVVKPIHIPGPLLAAIRYLVWNRTVARALPGPMRLPFWRLSLLISDGFWFDTSKFRAAYPGPLTGIGEALALMRSDDQLARRAGPDLSARAGS